jgi:hypothetical protein
VIEGDITITLNFSRFIVQDLNSFFLFVTCRKSDGEPKAIAMRLFVFTRKGKSKQPVWLYSEFFFFGGGKT